MTPSTSTPCTECGALEGEPCKRRCKNYDVTRMADTR